MSFSALRLWLHNTSHFTVEELESASQGWYARTSSPLHSLSFTPPKLPESPMPDYFRTQVSMDSTGSSEDFEAKSQEGFRDRDSRPPSVTEVRPPSVAGSVGMSSTSTAMGTQRGSLAHAALQYALRVFDQCERSKFFRFIHLSQF